MERKLGLTAGEAFALERLRRLRGAHAFVAPFWGSRVERWCPVACGSPDAEGGADGAVERAFARLMRQTWGRAAAKGFGRSHVFTGRARFGTAGGAGLELVLDGRILGPAREWSVELGKGAAGRLLDGLGCRTDREGTPRVQLAGFHPRGVEQEAGPPAVVADAFLADGPFVGRRIAVDPDRAARTAAEVLRAAGAGACRAPYGFHLIVSPEEGVLRLWSLEPEGAARWRIALRRETGRQALRSCTARHRTVHPGAYLLEALEDLFGEVRLPTGLAGDRIWEEPPWLASREKGWRLGAWLQTTYMRCGALADPALALYVCDGDGAVRLEREGGETVGARELLKVPGEALVRVLLRCGLLVGAWAEDGGAAPILDAVRRPGGALAVRTAVRTEDGPRLAWAWCWARREGSGAPAVPLLARSRETLRRARRRAEAERLFG